MRVGDSERQGRSVRPASRRRASFQYCLRPVAPSRWRLLQGRPACMRRLHDHAGDSRLERRRIGEDSGGDSPCRTRWSEAALDRSHHSRRLQPKLDQAAGHPHVGVTNGAGTNGIGVQADATRNRVPAGSDDRYRHEDLDPRIRGCVNRTTTFGGMPISLMSSLRVPPQRDGVLTNASGFSYFPTPVKSVNRTCALPKEARLTGSRFLVRYSIRLVDPQGGHETFGEYPLNVNL
jgi:hypothetical protein